MIIPEKVINKINKYITTDTDDCIEYPILNKDGYGEIQPRIDEKKTHYLMHRVAYQIFYKDDITSEDIICHKCDNPSCINPKHLFKGTHLENQKDKCKKGRQAKGSKNGRYIDGRASDHKVVKSKEKAYGRKLTEEQVLEVRRLRLNKATLKEISEITNISISSVKDICSGRTYQCYQLL